MAMKRGEHLSRLSIAPNINMQQPMGGMFSPALPTALQQSFHPGFPMVNPLQTPMQTFFNPNVPGAPGRPTHHPNQASMQLAAAGIHPPNLGPPPHGFMTPVAGHFPRPSISLGPGGQPQAPSHPYPGRNRRQLSIGGPPKAVLGGPARKLSPLPAAPGVPAPSQPATAPEKKKKMIVNLPKETVVSEDGESKTRQEWARNPSKDVDFTYNATAVAQVDISTAEIYPPDYTRTALPSTIDVYLPGKLAWEAIKHKDIEEKLEKLGVERGSGSNVPHIHAPHARAASISSPADPALLLFKLNKLHQAQEGTSSAGGTSNNSLSVSPQPHFVQPFGLSPSPHRLITNRHGHTMSLVNPLPYQPTLFPHSPGTTNGVIEGEFGGERIPTSVPEYNPPPLSAVGAPKSQMDFIRGFGLDVPLESEEEEDEADNLRRVEDAEDEADKTQDMELDDDESMQGDVAVEIDDASTTAPDSRYHSRHVSRISATLSLRSVGGNFQAQFENAQQELVEEEQPEEVVGNDHVVEETETPAEVDDAVAHDGRVDDAPGPVDPAAEWTGSEDGYHGNDSSDDESIGEYSNPSDEERARQARSERRVRRRAARQQTMDQPRRIPDFPRPPATSHLFGARADDDIISNPSEENLILSQRAELLGVHAEEYYPDTASNPSLHIPHSRVASGQYSVHDPARAHSRQPSEQFTYPGSLSGSVHHSNPSGGVKNLNPFAKPFVFGAPRTANSGSGSWQPFAGEATPPMPVPNVAIQSLTHSRVPSLGKPLSAAAAEFKPGSFNFKLPGAPQMPLPIREPSILVPPPMPAPPMPVPHLNEDNIIAESSPFKVQGREKRQRVDSVGSVEEGDSMTSFRFPPLRESSPKAIRRHRSGELFSSSGDAKPKLNPTAQPFTFAGFSAVANNMPWMPKADEAVVVDSAVGMMKMPEPEFVDIGGDSGTVRPDVEDEEGSEGQDIEFPMVQKGKRAPIPLDFKHPVSSATVPAGLFKALANAEERTRRGVRSRLSSREIFDHVHRPSMDDTNVGFISRKASRNHLVTDPGVVSSPKVNDDDVFSSVRPHVRRRSSLPDALVDREESLSELSVSPQDLTSRMELHRVENAIAQLLDEKLEPIRTELTRREFRGEPGLSPNTESLMADVISLFRAQLQESATKSLEDSQMDARGELDFQMIKDIIQQSHKELLSAFQRDMHHIAQQIPVSNGHGHNPEILHAIDGVGNRTVNAVVEAISELSARQEAVALNTPARERDLTVEKIVTVLAPMFESLRTDPVDYEFLTRELAQAVKPHISQLIDLASDKRETASLIVDQILPLLPSLNNAPIDTDTLTLKLITEVRRAIAPIDAFEIKEQVADLVVERLDSRLAVRDKAFNVDVVTTKVTENVSKIMEPLVDLPAAVRQLSDAHKVAEEQQSSLATSQSAILASITDVPNKVGTQLEDLKATQDVILGKVSSPLPTAASDTNIIAIKALLETVAAEQEKAALQGMEATSQALALSSKLDSLPGTLSSLVDGLQKTLTDLISSKDTSKRDLEELRRLNTEYQHQLNKARSSHGQVRVEKDAVNEKLSVVEGDRDRLRNQVKELQTAAASKVTETSALEARNKELEEALSKALGRLQSTDVASQADQRAIADLEKANKTFVQEQDGLRTKVTTLEAEVVVARREKETAISNLESLQQRHDQLSSQQTNWDALNAASEKINMVHKLLTNADEEDQHELRQQRERTRALEAENLALQKRTKEIELKLTNSEKAASTTRQTLTQAQQRSSEWERRAKEYEGQLEMVRTKLEQSEQTHAQLEQDHHLAKMQVDEHEANSRLAQDNEAKLKEQIAALETKVIRMQTELEKANAAAKFAASPTPFRPHNGTSAYPTPSRPDSRASTAYDPAPRRVSTLSTAPRNNLTPSTNSTSQGPSVWDSMHAPSTGGQNGPVQQNGQSKWSAPAASMHAPSSRYHNYVPSTPKARRPVYNQYQRGAPSPTPSVVSAAPTQGEDGWWS